MHLWCQFIPQSTTTLNLLCPSRIDPCVSVELILNGAFNYNKTSIAPSCTKVIVHETPSTSKTWAQHGVGGEYISGAPGHYRYHCV